MLTHRRFVIQSVSKGTPGMVSLHFKNGLVITVPAAKVPGAASGTKVIVKGSDGIRDVQLATPGGVADICLA